MNQNAEFSKAWYLFAAFTKVLVIAVPLLVYVLFWSLVSHQTDLAELWRKPEWMFIALMLQIEAMRDTTKLATEYGLAAHPLADNNRLLDIVLIVLIALVLFVALAHYEHAFVANAHLGTVQFILLACIAAHCIWLKYKLFLCRHFAEQSPERKAP